MSSVSSMSLILVVSGYIIYCSSYNVLVHFEVTDFRVNEMETWIGQYVSREVDIRVFTNIG
jgi:hypothetical protein